MPDLHIVWAKSAEKSFFDTLEKIEQEDSHTAKLFVHRVEKSLSLIAFQPNLGTFTAMTGVRRYPIPNTGHAINYRVIHGELRVMRFYRQRQTSS